MKRFVISLFAGMVMFGALGFAVGRDLPSCEGVKGLVDARGGQLPIECPEY